MRRGHEQSDRGWCCANQALQRIMNMIIGREKLKILSDTIG
jgi:hypothetical protein